MDKKMFQSKKQQQAARFKEFVKAKSAGNHPEWRDQKATGTHNLIDEQNKLIDKHNLRK